MKKKESSESVATEGIRINKYLSDCGVCSRRQADHYIEESRITVNEVTAVMGTKVFPKDTVKLDGKALSKEEEFILLAMNKPRGIVCTSQKGDPDNIIDFLNYPKRVYPIGRLDKDSEGLILLTNDGSIVNKILKGSNYHEKEYIVTVNKPITAKFLEDMSAGVPILDTVTRPCKISPINKLSFQVVLTQGLNRQIRRMCEYLGYRVVTLQRIRVMNIQLGRLKVGTWRKVTESEINELYRLVSMSIDVRKGLDTKNERQVTGNQRKGRRTK